MVLKFGPTTIGNIKEISSTFKKYSSFGFKVAAVPFTYKVFIKEIEQARFIKKEAEKNNIELSVHAPYYINLNSEGKKLEESKKRILESCKIAHYMGAKIVVIHCGFYGKKSKEETYQNIKNEILKLQKEIKKNKWDVKLAPETMGKINVFGNIEEILKLVDETSCSFCLDFAHLLARSNGKMSYKEIYEKFSKFQELYCHFSGIVYGEKGEKYHKSTPDEEIVKLLKILPKNKNIVIINESPNTIEDSIKSLKIAKSLGFLV